MSGAEVKNARERRGWTQQQAARRWKVSQTYVSMVERDKRRVPARLARLLARQEREMATGLPPDVPTTTGDGLPRLLGSLGYPGFAYLADPNGVAHPAAVLMAALRQKRLPARATAALPWLLVTFANLDWDWLLGQAKLSNLQNRLGYLVHLARSVAHNRGDLVASNHLFEAEQKLEEARLVKEDTLGRTLTEAERRYLRDHRPHAAEHWNLLTNLRTEDLADAF